MLGWLQKLYYSERTFFFAAPAFAWQLLFFYMPLALMGIISFYSSATHSFSFEQYFPFFQSAYFFIIFRSLILALVNGIFCFLIGYPLACFLAYMTDRFKLLFLFLLILPFWTNFLLHIASWFFVLDRGGVINTWLLKIGIIHEPLHLLNSFFGIILLMVYCYLPFMVLPIYSTLDRLDSTLFEASSDLGATSFETWYHIILPLSMPGVMTGFFLVFVPSFGEFAIPGLMGGDKYLFVGSVIAQFAQGIQTIGFATAFTVMSFSFLFVCIFLGYWLKRLILAYTRSDNGA